MSSEIIASSSSGNAILLENGIMLDMGITFKKAKSYLDKTKVIFISHTHS